MLKTSVKIFNTRRYIKRYINIYFFIGQQLLQNITCSSECQTLTEVKF